jgi:hypothetical protein
MPEKPNNDSANQAGLRTWTTNVIQSHAAAIGLALEFDDGKNDGKKDGLPSDQKLVEELGRAAEEFGQSPKAMWRVLKARYRQSDAALDAWAEQFVVDYNDRLRDTNARRQLGDIDDEEPADDDTRPLKAVADEAIKEAVKIRAEGRRH